MRTAVALLAALLALRAPAAAAGLSCEQLADRSRRWIQAISPSASSPCRSKPPGSGCDPREVWAAMRALYVRHLSSVPGDEVGRAAAEFLAASSVAIGAIDMTMTESPQRFGLHVPRENSVYVRARLLEPVWEKLEGSALPPEAGAAVEVTAATLVHELRHARQLQELGYIDDGFFESESLAYADEALFLWARLERDPDYAGMAEYNRVLLSTAGFPAPPDAEWWKQPIEMADVPRLKQFKDVAKTLMGASLRGDTVNSWYMARSLGAGFDRMNEMVRWFMDDDFPSVYELAPDFYERRYRGKRKYLKKLERCLARERDARVRDDFRLLMRDVEGDLRFNSDAAEQRRLLRYYREERAKQERLRARML